MIAGLILAGGAARRLGGGDKGLLAIAGRPMLAHVVARLAPQVDRLALNANGDPDRFAWLALPVVNDGRPDLAGPLAGLAAGLRWAVDEVGAAWLATAAADMPLLPDDLVARLKATAEAAGTPIAIARSAGRPSPVTGLWSVALADDLAAFLAAGGRRMLDWVDRHPHGLADLPPVRIAGRSVDPLLNVNTPADLAEVRRLLGEGQSA